MAYIAAAPMRILFLARSLETGGAERQLVNLAAGLSRRGHDVRVAVFYPQGALRNELEASGVPLIDLGKRSRWDLAAFALRSVRAIRAFRPEIVHGYLVAPNLLSVLARAFAPGASIVWGVRASEMDFSRYDLLSRSTFALSVSLSRWADLVVLFDIMMAMMKLMAPILSFTAEEIWRVVSAQVPGGLGTQSVHLASFPEVDPLWRNTELAARWETLLDYRSQVQGVLEASRRDKVIASSLEAHVQLKADAKAYQFLKPYERDLGTIFIVS